MRPFPGETLGRLGAPATADQLILVAPQRAAHAINGIIERGTDVARAALHHQNRTLPNTGDHLHSMLVVLLVKDSAQALRAIKKPNEVVHFTGHDLAETGGVHMVKDCYFGLHIKSLHCRRIAGCQLRTDCLRQLAESRCATSPIAARRVLAQQFAS